MTVTTGEANLYYSNGHYYLPGHGSSRMSSQMKKLCPSLPAGEAHLYHSNGHYYLHQGCIQLAPGWNFDPDGSVVVVVVVVDLLLAAVLDEVSSSEMTSWSCHGHPG